MKKNTKKSLLAIAITLTATITIVWFAKYVVITGEKEDKLTNAHYGYKIEQNFFLNRMILTIWNSAGVTISYDLHSMTIDEVEESRWLSNGRGVYLNLRIKYHNSSPSVSPAKIAYDFQRGELYLTSPIAFGRVFNESNPVNKNWMTESEFQEALSRLSQ